MTTTYRIDYADIDGLPTGLYRGIMGDIAKYALTYAYGQDYIIFTVCAAQVEETVAYFACRDVPLYSIDCHTCQAQQQAARDALVAHRSAMPVQPTFPCSSDAIIAYAAAIQAWVERNKELEAACMATV